MDFVQILLKEYGHQCSLNECSFICFPIPIYTEHNIYFFLFYTSLRIDMFTCITYGLDLLFL